MCSGTRAARGGEQRAWRLAIDLTSGWLHFDGMALHDEPDLSRWPGGVDIGFGQRIDYDHSIGAPANPVKLQLPASTMQTRAVTIKAGQLDHVTAAHLPCPSLYSRS